MREKDELLIANTILNVTASEGRLLGAKPDEEEIAAYIDGAIDSPRKEEIESYIVHDSDIYQEWLAVHESLGSDLSKLAFIDSEIMTTVIETQAPARTEASQNNESWFAQFKHLLADLMSPYKLAGAAGALSVFLAVFIVFSSGSSQIDSLYEQYGDTSISQLRSFRIFGKPQDENQTQFRLGYLKGLSQLGMDTQSLFEAMHIQPDTEVAAQQNTQAYLFYQLGLFSVLAEKICQEESRRATFNDASKALLLSMSSQIEKTLGSAAKHSQITKLTSEYKRSLDACVYGNALIKANL